MQWFENSKSESDYKLLFTPLYKSLTPVHIVSNWGELDPLFSEYCRCRYRFRIGMDLLRILLIQAYFNTNSRGISDYLYYMYRIWRPIGRCIWIPKKRCFQLSPVGYNMNRNACQRRFLSFVDMLVNDESENYFFYRFSILFDHFKSVGLITNSFIFLF